MAQRETIKTQDKTRERKYFDDFVAEFGDHDLCVPESYDLVLHGFGLGIHEKPLKILDVGNGTGRWSEMLARRGNMVWGFDLSLGMAKAGKAREGLKGKFFPFVGDVEYMAIKPASFDVCFGAGILHHLPSLSGILSEAERVLTENGRFCFFEPNGSNPLMRLSYFLRIIFDRFMKASGKVSSVNEQTHSLKFYEKEFSGRFSDLQITPIYITQKHNPAFEGILSIAMKTREALIKFLYLVLPARYGCNFVLILGRKK